MFHNLSNQKVNSYISADWSGDLGMIHPELASKWEFLKDRLEVRYLGLQVSDKTGWMAPKSQRQASGKILHCVLSWTNQQTNSNLNKTD